ncbi:MAG TPA: hypothetical protein V6C97_28710 [Oculatellaceae cyanobacterium]
MKRNNLAIIGLLCAAICVAAGICFGYANQKHAPAAATKIYIDTLPAKVAEFRDRSDGTFHGCVLNPH